MRLAKSIAALRIACVEESAIGEDNANRLQHFVAIGMDATTHARGIVGDDATHHSTFDRCRVGAEFAAVGSKKFVDTLTNDTRLKDNAFAIVEDSVFFPFFAHYGEDVVADGLTRKACASSAPSDVSMLVVGFFYEVYNVSFRVGVNDRLRK